MKWSPPLAAEISALSVAACVLFSANIILWNDQAVEDLDLRDALNASNVQTFHPSITGNPSSDCATCHIPKQQVIQAGLWAGSAITGSNFLAVTPEHTSNETRMCTSCHDGSVSHKIGLNGPSGEHPMGMDYAAVYDRDPQNFVSPYNSPIKLENGKVGCLSCHAVHENTGYKANARPNNCRTCHK